MAELLMNQEIEGSEIVTTIISRIKFDFRDDISIFACYGSAVTENEYKLSDLGFYIVPKTERGFLITKSFLLSSLGCDLWPLSWEQITDISNCETNMTSILADSKVMFYSTEEDFERFEKAKDNIHKTLNHKTKNKKLCNERLKDIKRDYFDIVKLTDGFNWDIKIISFLENYLIALATLNKTYVHKGLQNFRNEIINYKYKPYDLKGKLQKVLNGINKNRIKMELKSLLFDLIDLIPGSIKGFTNFKHEDFDKLLNRFKLIYPKLELACEDYDEELTIELANKIDEKTDKLVNDKVLSDNLPCLKPYAEASDFKQLLSECQKHESYIDNLFRLFEISIAEYSSIKDLNSPFM